MNKNKLYFFYNNQKIEFVRKASRSKRYKMRITINAQGVISVFTPKLLSDIEVINLVQEKSLWILKKIKNVQENIVQIERPQYVSGELHYFLGKGYKLNIIKHSKKDVILGNDNIYIYAHNVTSESIKKQLHNWYKVEALAYFQKRMLSLLEKTPWVTKLPILKVRTMKRQWGNCSIKGNITLNTHLIKASQICIDYVILHELCHIAKHNHSPAFYKLMTQVMPHWKTIKKELDAMVNCYVI